MTPILQTLAGLSSAEQIFATLELPFDQTVLDVHRLHLLKRFREHLKPLGPAPDTAAVRAALARAYDEYAGGAGPKSFKVFRQAQGFVALGDIAPLR